MSRASASSPLQRHCTARSWLRLCLLSLFVAGAAGAQTGSDSTVIIRECPTATTVSGVPWENLGIKSPQHWDDVLRGLGEALADVRLAILFKREQLAARLRQLGLPDGCSYKQILRYCNDKEALRLLDELMELSCKKMNIKNLMSAARTLKGASATIAADAIKISCSAGGSAARNAAVASGFKRLLGWMGKIGGSVCLGVVMNVLMTDEALGADSEVLWCEERQPPPPMFETCEEYIHAVAIAHKDIAAYQKKIDGVNECWRMIWPPSVQKAKYMRDVHRGRLHCVQENFARYCSIELNICTGELELVISDTPATDWSIVNPMKEFIWQASRTAKDGQEVNVKELCECTVKRLCSPRSTPVPGGSPQAPLSPGTTSGGGTCNKECCECDMPRCDWTHPCDLCEQRCVSACGGNPACKEECHARCWPSTSDPLCYPASDCGGPPGDIEDTDNPAGGPASM
jgi:hypothetical protein